MQGDLHDAAQGARVCAPVGEGVGACPAIQVPRLQLVSYSPLPTRVGRFLMYSCTCLLAVPYAPLEGKLPHL